MKYKYLKNIQEFLTEQVSSSKIWYHGSPDVRELEKTGFVNSTKSVSYISDIDGFNRHQEEMNTARENGDMKKYHELLNTIDKYKKNFVYNKPVFLSDKYSIAKTYAVPERAFDYQNSVEKVLEVETTCKRIATIVAFNDRFRFVSIYKVKQGFINSGISEEEIEKLILMFNYYIPGNKGIQTDVIAAIGNYLGFDCIDVVGVLDSYHGGTEKSTVRMILDSTDIKIIK